VEDGSLRVVEVADKGKGRFDTGGGGRALTPIGRVVFPAGSLDLFEEAGRARGGSWTTPVSLMARERRLAGCYEARFFGVVRRKAT
jgi:hypothetical protein